MSESNGAADGPRTFRDSAGRLWVVKVTVAGLKRIRDLTGTDVSGMTVGELADHLGNPLNLVDVCFALVQPVAEQRGVGDVEFGESQSVATIAEMEQTVWRSFADFSRPQTRRAMLDIASKVWGEPTAPTSSDSPTSSPASSGLTPTPGPSAS